MVPTVARADDSPANYEPVFIPKCDIYTLRGGAEVCGFEATVWFGQVLTVDAKLVHTLEQLKNESARSVELSSQVESLQGQLRLMGENNVKLKAYAAKQTDELIALDKKYQDERVKPRWGNPLAWTVAAVSTAVLAGFVIKEFAD